jgi:hypothetical protein
VRDGEGAPFGIRLGGRGLLVEIARSQDLALPDRFSASSYVDTACADTACADAAGGVAVLHIDEKRTSARMAGRMSPS